MMAMCSQWLTLTAVAEEEGDETVAVQPHFSDEPLPLVVVGQIGAHRGPGRPRGTFGNYAHRRRLAALREQNMQQVAVPQA